MSDFLLEIFRALLLLVVLSVMVRATRPLSRVRGWMFFLAGMSLVFVGTVVDVTDNYPALSRLSPLLGQSMLHEFFEEVVCYLGGITLIVVGLAKWLPSVRELAEMQHRHESIHAMTTDLTGAIAVGPERDMHMTWTVGTLHREAGYTDEDIALPEQWIAITYEEDRPLLQRHIETTLETGFAESELRLLKADGTPLWVKIVSRAERPWEPGTTIETLTAVRDIHERKAAEERTLDSLRQNETLVQELHHRVKNNLQIITGLMEIAKGRITDPDVGRICQDINAKIHSMALVHDKLYASGDMGHIDFSAYARALTEQIVDMFGAQDVAVRLDLDPVFVDIAKAVPCGLALNELLTNAFKHGIPAQGGRVSVSVAPEGDHAFRIVVSDNGPGLPEGFTAVDGSHMGLRLLDNIVSLQLGGSLEFSSGDGTRATVHVSLND